MANNAQIPAVYHPLLVRILAETEALFTPWRDWRAVGGIRVGTAIRERRLAYFDSGLAFVGGGAVLTRKRVETGLAALREFGAVQTFSKAGKHRTVRLTAYGDDAARWITAAPLAADTWPLLKLIARLEKDPAAMVNLDYVSEFSILRTKPEKLENAQPLVGLENNLAPALSRGWLDSNADRGGHVGYCLTPAGRTVLSGKRPRLPSGLPEFNEDLGNTFHAQHLTGLRDRLSWEPDSPSAVSIPLAVGGWSADTQDEQDDAQPAVFAPECDDSNASTLDT